ncbi:ESX secretion-associated protein EspG [Mycolicibacillus parakoreensis]|uniref:ESX secretion-associated protein EspG n=1 Tax=Mycolicibacillus parakoreensis TaxID=1069221 RepID=A0ABY3U599_9MYCO|nr:ESX secretion-associated protein EspG [Mycolicibacillus parakoreensis]MCV7314739.1 ESX secretion-associated protein EspG [Mycolicibacillus parakoreensis]ULN53745.1 ESX secretion-associated protein EspG [Mycolicibacillus parakoreensis]
MEQQHSRTDITVNVEGFWLLQALLDIRHVAPELRCRPFVSTSESTDWLKEHPGMAVMREQGIVVDDDLTVNEEVAERMGVLAVPDIEVVALLSYGKLRYGVSEDAIQRHQDNPDQGEQPAVDDKQVGSRDIPDNEFRVVLARRDDHWVSAVRVGTDITVDDVSVDDAASIAALVTGAMESINHADPAVITAVNVPLDEMLSVTKAWQAAGFNVFSSGDLRRIGLTAATIAALGQALSEPAAEAAIYARQYRDDARESSASVLSLKDGSAGRLAMYQQARTVGSSQKWLAICPATPQLVQVGVQTVLDTVPFGSWKTHRRV